MRTYVVLTSRAIMKALISIAHTSLSVRNGIRNIFEVQSCTFLQHFFVVIDYLERRRIQWKFECYDANAAKED